MNELAAVGLDELYQGLRPSRLIQDYAEPPVCQRGEGGNHGVDSGKSYRILILIVLTFSNLNNILK